MALKSRSDLIRMTLEFLNAVAAGQTPAAEDVETLDKLIDGKVAELARRRIIWVPDPNAIEEELLEPLATLLGDLAAPSFGQPRDAARRVEAENRLREMQCADDTTAVVRADYF
jgi:hypothetical protein